MQFDLGLLGFALDELARLMSGDVQPGLTDPDDVSAPSNTAAWPSENVLDLFAGTLR
jgi:hypothetical protein